MASLMVVQKAILDKGQSSKVKTLAAIFQEQGVFEKLQINAPEQFFETFSLIVNGNSIQALDVEVSQFDQVVVLPRIIGG